MCEQLVVSWCDTHLIEIELNEDLITRVQTRNWWGAAVAAVAPATDIVLHLAARGVASVSKVGPHCADGCQVVSYIQFQVGEQALFGVVAQRKGLRTFLISNKNVGISPLDDWSKLEDDAKSSA